MRAKTHTDRDAKAYVESAIANCGENPEDYFVDAIAEELYDTHGTWDMARVYPDDFWPVVMRHFAGGPLGCDVQGCCY